jgi:hypothetical protein
MLITVTPVGGELILSKLLFLLYFILPLVFAPCTLLLGPSLAYSLLEAQNQGPKTLDQEPGVTEPTPYQ